jgi:hypothetical protein
VTTHASPATTRLPNTSRPPAWLIVATGLLGAAILAMAVAETNLWMHYLIDAGESFSLAGLAFMLGAGVYLYRQRRLMVSLPLAVPWLLFPVITQGDQIIDNLSIGWMQFVCHVLLAIIFGTPVAIVVLAVRYVISPRPPGARIPGWFAVVPGCPQFASGRTREGVAFLSAFLLVLEIWVADRFLGLLMVVTLIAMIAGVLIYGSVPISGSDTDRQRRSEKVALTLLLIGVVLSIGLFFGYKNRPGAYQGSPSYFMDPSQKGSMFALDRITVPAGDPVAPLNPAATRDVLTRYAQSFEQLLSGYYILDRNYNYDFHNHLFLRSTPLLPDYRRVGVDKTHEAVQMRLTADAAFDAIAPSLPVTEPLGALAHDVRAYAAFTFDRVPTLERMTTEFVRTDAGLQHATHLYEGEGKVLGVQLNEILKKHARVLSSPATAPVTSEFATVCGRVYQKYADRIVGF